MTILYINTGSSPNSGDGDTLRTAFNKVNATFAYFDTVDLTTASQTLLDLQSSIAQISTSTSWNLTTDGCPIDVSLTTNTYAVQLPKSHLFMNNDGSWDFGSYYNGSIITGDNSGNLVMNSYNRSATIIVDNYNWEFNNSGNLILPDNTSINSGGQNVRNSAQMVTSISRDVNTASIINQSSIALEAGNGGISIQVFGPYTGGADGSGGPSLVFAGTENVSGSNGPGFAGIVASDPNVTSQYAVTLDGSNNILIGATQPGQVTTTTEYTVGIGALSTVTGNMTGVLATPDMLVLNNTNNAWVFDNFGGLVFPDSSTQNTAWDPSYLSSYATLQSFNNAINSSTVAIGTTAGASTQGTYAVAIGDVAGRYTQGSFGVAIGYDAGNLNQGSTSVAIGYQAGATTQAIYAVSIGNSAGSISQGQGSVAMGASAGKTTQGNYSVAIGYNAAQTSQGGQSVAIGYNAGGTSQGGSNVAVGYGAGANTQTIYAVAIGLNAGGMLQGRSSVAIGRNAGANTQTQYAIAIGESAGQYNQGQFAIAVGYNAGLNNQPASSIILNATGNAFTATNTNAVYVTPIRISTATSVLYYNTLTNEVTAGAPGGVTYITGTANQVIVNANVGTVTLTTPQSIATNSNVTFAAITGTSNIITTVPITAQSNIGAFAYGTLSYSDINILASYSSSTSTYNQKILQNTSTSSNASANFNVSNNQATSSTFFGEFGMNSSNFTGTNSFSYANNVYLAAASSDLVVGTYAANAIRFNVNSSSTDSIVISTTATTVNTPMYARAITSNNTVTAVSFQGSGSQLTGVAIKTTGSWTLATGTNTVSFTVPLNGTYAMWVNGNIPNGIVTWNASAVITNPNVPALGTQYAWYYPTGNNLVFTSIPNQFTGTTGVISSSTAYVGTSSNVFTFGITNNTTGTQIVNWGYTAL